MSKETLLTFEIGMRRNVPDRDVSTLRRVITENAPSRGESTDVAVPDEELGRMHMWGVQNHVLDCYCIYRMLRRAYGGILVLTDRIAETRSAYMLGLNYYYPAQLSSDIRYDTVLPCYYTFLFNKRRTEDFTNAVKSLEGAVIDGELSAGVSTTDAGGTLAEEKITVMGIPVKGELLRLITDNCPSYRADRFPAIGAELLDKFLSSCCYSTKREREKACSFLERVSIGDPDDLEALCGLLRGVGNLEAAEALLSAGLDWRIVSTREALGKGFGDGGHRKADALRRCIRLRVFGEEWTLLSDELRIPDNVREVFTRIRYFPSRCVVLPYAKALFRAGREKESIERLEDLCPTYDEDYEVEEDVLADIPETPAGLRAVREYLRYYDGSENARCRLKEIRQALRYR